jgi:hypothetical protein
MLEAEHGANLGALAAERDQAKATLERIERALEEQRERELRVPLWQLEREWRDIRSKNAFDPSRRGGHAQCALRHHHARAAHFQRHVDLGKISHGCPSAMLGADQLRPRCDHHREGRPPSRQSRRPSCPLDRIWPYGGREEDRLHVGGAAA